LYCIAYRISDDIKAQKEAIKPFWWEHLHPEVKEETIEEVEKELLETGNISAEKIAEMPKNEKYMALSEGYYCIDCQNADKAAQELEALKKEVEQSKTLFLNQPSASQPATQQSQQSQQSQIIQQDSLEPIAIGQRPLVDIPPVTQGSGIKLDDEHLSIVSSQIKDEDLKDDSSPFGGALKGDDKIPATSPSKAELRRYAQSIVSATIKDINNKADSIPDDVAVMKEQELLQAVVDELKAVSSKK
jgi:hypothetical protein